MWEYTAVVWEPKGDRRLDWFVGELNRLGSDGWEAVEITISAVARPGYIAFLKRRVPTGSTPATTAAGRAVAP